MKKLEFETDKGKFLIVDLPLDVVRVKNNGEVLFFDDLTYSSYYDVKSEYGFLLKQITEKQASKIVNSLQSGTVLGEIVTGVENTTVEIYKHDGRSIKFLTALNCLNSLLK